MKRTVLITGGASGIGYALARYYGESGASVAVIDFSDGTQNAVKTLREQGIDVRGYVCDITGENQVNDTVSRIVSECGDIDILFNNAGTTQRSPFDATALEVYRRVFEINFFAQVMMTRAALESIKKTRGSIVVTSSIAGVVPLAGRTGYSASKHALHGFFETLSAEMIPHGVHVLVVCPGFTRTALQSRALGGDGKSHRRIRNRKSGRKEVPMTWRR